MTSNVARSFGSAGASRGTYASLSVSPVVDDTDGKKRSGYHWTAKRHTKDLLSDVEVGKEAARRTLRKLGAKKVETYQATRHVKLDRDQLFDFTFANTARVNVEEYKPDPP
jgi:predicted Zn-dependent protease